MDTANEMEMSESYWQEIKEGDRRLKGQVGMLECIGYVRPENQPSDYIP